MKLAYLKLDATNPGYSAALAALEAEFKVAFPANGMSVNANKDGTQVWVKACADSDVPDAVLLDSAPLEDAARVSAEVSAESWTGPRRARPGQR